MWRDERIALGNRTVQRAEKEIEREQGPALSLEPERVRGWVRDLLGSVLGEIGISWEKFHVVIDDMQKYVKEQEAKFASEAGPF